MKKSFLIINVIAVFLLITGCPDSTNVKNSSDLCLPEGYGAVCISSAQDVSRTAMPDVAIDQLDFKYFLNETEIIPDKKDKTDALFILKEGPYYFAVKAYLKDYINDPELKPVAESSVILLSITAGEKSTVEIILKPAIASAGTGTINTVVDMSELNGDPVVFSITLSGLFDDSVISLSDPDTDLEPVMQYTKDVPAGYYLLCVIVYSIFDENTQGCAVKTEVIHIKENLQTIKIFTFNPNELIMDAVYNANDDGPGSLRHAIDYKDDPVINVMLPSGSVIKLNNPIQIIRSVIIEGNGVTIIPGDYWNVNEYSQLIIIDGQQNTNATIRRIHFKDGKSDYYGGAIDNRGNLTIESCIFSGNTSIHGNGGAIYSQFGYDLIVKGSTFYNNSANEFGGAIFVNYGTATLTGNVFYENTSERNQVGFGDGNIFTSYNVVYNKYDEDEMLFADPDFGGLNNKIIQSEPLPFSPETFRVIDYSMTINKNALPDFPARDFYGNSIYSANAWLFAGAVQEWK